MRWQTKVKPPNRDHYLNKCAALQRSLRNADVMPPFLIVANCLFVLRKAFGSDWRIIRWLLLNMAHDRWSNIRYQAWETWHYHIMQRTRDEMIELIDRDIEKITGTDCREWPDVISDEEVKTV